MSLPDRQTREMLDRYDDLKSGKVKPIDGEGLCPLQREN
jgi:hypothetical protein